MHYLGAASSPTWRVLSVRAILRCNPWAKPAPRRGEVLGLEELKCRVCDTCAALVEHEAEPGPRPELAPQSNSSAESSHF